MRFPPSYNPQFQNKAGTVHLRRVDPVDFAGERKPSANSFFKPTFAFCGCGDLPDCLRMACAASRTSAPPRAIRFRCAY